MRLSEAVKIVSQAWRLAGIPARSWSGDVRSQVGADMRKAAAPASRWLVLFWAHESQLLSCFVMGVITLISMQLFIIVFIIIQYNSHLPAFPMA
jgi:hypothetical protein